jgi:glycosyltransferase involved in cell wall biosynthesis
VRRGVDVTVIGVRAAHDRDAEPGTDVALHSDDRFLLVRSLRPMRKRLSSILHDSDFELVHALGLLPAGYTVTHVDDSTMRCVITAHGSRRQDTLAAYRGATARARWLLGRRLILSAVEKANAVIGVHPDWHVNLPSRPSRYVYIPNIVDDRFFTLVRRPVEGRVLYCGGETAIKGWDVLLAAWPLVLKRVPEARLQAVGCASAHIPPALRASIVTSPWLASVQLADAMAEAAVVVIPSRFEVAPTVLSEAWAARAPVVATAVGGVPRLATGAAHLVDVPDPVELASTLVHALREPDRELVEEGARRAEPNREDVVVDAHLDIYRSLLV